MFWSGNFMAVRELNSLLKEENVTLASVLEADDILQECKADNKALIQFLTRPDILAELVTLITEEPPKHVKLSQQYRLASIACEVLTSHLATLSDRLTMDTAQMNRLCDFLNQDPPLNPLLASYFSKTVEMLLERSSKQDWYLYHIVCLRVLDFFKSRRDFLPNLLRHLATSAVADTFKYLIRLDDLFNKPVMEWLEQHQFIDSLIGIICGSYAPEPCPPEPCPPEPCPPEPCPPDAPEKEQRDTSEREYNDNLLLQLPYLDTMVDIIQRAYAKPCPPKPCPPEPCPPDAPEKGQRETSQKEHNDNAPLDLNNSYDNSESSAQSSSESPNRNSVPGPAEAEAERVASAARAERARGVAAHNAAALLCELVATGCAAEGACARSRTAWQLAGALAAPRTVRALLSAVFTCAPRHRARALHHAARLLLQLLHHHAERSEGGEGLRGVELAVAPHLPLLHQALLRVAPYDQEERGGAAGAGEGEGAARVGAARVSTAALLAQLALSDVEEVASTLLTLGTPGLLVELLFAFPQNNFLHAQVVAFCRNALSNRLYRLQYATHLFVECDLLTRLMDAFQENEIDTLGRGARAGYMGHVVSLLGWCGAALGAGGARGEGGEAPLPAPAAALRRLARLQEDHLAALLHRLDTPLGGSYPSENMYDTGEEMEHISDTLAATYDDLSQMTSEKDDYYVAEMSAAAEHGDSAHFVADGLGLPSAAEHDMTKAQNSFLELASQRFDDDMWDSPEPEEFSQQPWGGAGQGAGQGADAPVWEDEGEGDGAAAGGEGWAQFDAFSAPPPKDPFAPYWAEPPPQEGAAAELCAGLDALALAAGGGAALASNLLTAMSGMTPAAIANIVNANLQPLPMHAQVLSPSSDGPPAAPAPAPAPLPCDPAPASNQPTGVTSPKQVTLPAEVSLTTEVTLPNDLKSDFPDSSNSNPPIKENCVTPLTEIPDESISSEILTEGEVDDLSDKVSEVTDIAVEAEEATEPAAEATEASER